MNVKYKMHTFSVDPFRPGTGRESISNLVFLPCSTSIFEKPKSPVKSSITLASQSNSSLLKITFTKVHSLGIGTVFYSI